MAAAARCFRDTPAGQLIRGVGFALAAVYLLWNASWIALGEVAPSLFTGLTGLPCPTTGATRSVLALCRGDIGGSLYFNPMTLPILALLAATALALGWSVVKRKRLGLPKAFLYVWAGTLLIAWGLKFLSPTTTW